MQNCAERAYVATCNNKAARHGSSRFHSQDILLIESAPPRLAHPQQLLLLHSYYLYLLPYTQSIICLDSNCNCRIAPNTTEIRWEILPLVDSHTSLQLQMGGLCRSLIFGGTPDIYKDPVAASSKAQSHQNFRGELGLSSALGQKAQQRHHLLLGAH